MSIFLSQPRKPNVQPPLSFRENDNSSDMPGSLNDAQVYAYSLTYNPSWQMYRAHFSHHIYATHTQAVVLSTKSPFMSILDAPEDHIFSTPEIGVDFKSKSVPEDFALWATAKGFVTESTGPRAFFRGHINGKKQITKICSFGTEIDTFVPYGVTSIRGLMAMHLLETLVRAVGNAIPYPSNYRSKRINFFPSLICDETIDTGDDDDELPRPVFEGSEKPTHALHLRSMPSPVIKLDNSASIGPHTTYQAVPSVKGTATMLSKDAVPVTSGYLFPYFEGLIVGHRSTVMQYVQQHIHNLGSSSDEAASALNTIKIGFKSLCHTKSGLEIAHAIHCQSIALSTGSKPVIIKSASSKYLGCVLYGTAVVVVKDGVEQQILTKEELCNRIKLLDSHAGAISSLVELLNELPPRGDPEGTETLEKLTDESLTTARQLHYAIVDRHISPETRIRIQGFVKHVKYEQVYWSPTDATSIGHVIKSVGSKSRLPITAPFAFQGTQLFTGNVIESTLLAFGAKAPSLLGPVGGEVFRMPSKNKIYVDPTGKSKITSDKKQKGLTPVLSSIGIYTKPIIQATMDWNQVRSEKFLRYNTNARKQITGAARVFNGGAAHELLSVLCETFTASEDKKKEVKAKGKRSREDSDTDMEKDTLKRAKANSQNVLSIFSDRVSTVIQPEETDEEMYEE